MTTGNSEESRQTAGATAEAGPILEIPAALTVHDLASLMDVDAIEVIKQLMRDGYMLTINEIIEFDIALMIARSFGFRVKAPAAAERGPGSLVISADEEESDKLVPRPPVVTILGHVDHGKTTLLDAIRQSKVVVGEAGGITQHIGAYQVDYKGHLITFLDTPGHEAFTAMRARGAQITDLAVLVVAADDGIMPQTVEAINHVKAAAVPQIAVINKMDRSNADPERVKRQLAENDLLVEDWGGDVIAVPVSALKGEGISDLLENILLVAEVGELKADPNRAAKGVVVEARLDKSRGPVATVLVQTGTLKVGDIVAAGGARGRVKAMLDDDGVRIKTAGPSTPAEILGLGGLPDAGDLFEVTADQRIARALVEEHEREKETKSGRFSLEDIRARIESGEAASLDLVVKTDVQGTIEPIRGALEHLSSEETRVNVIHSASGSITEGDVLLAMASKAIIVGFNTVPSPGAQALAQRDSVDIRFYDVIYDLIDDIDKALKGLLAPVVQDIVEGYGTVRGVFSVARRRRAAGIHVNNGRIARGATIRVLRAGKPVFEGVIASLKHFKDDVRELNSGQEGGVVLDGFQEFQEGDVIEAHRTTAG